MVSFVPVICSKLTLAKSRLSERPSACVRCPWWKDEARVESVAAIDDETKGNKGIRKRAAAEDGRTGEEQASRHYQGACRDLFPAWTEVGSASESVLLRMKACVSPQASA